MVLNHVDLSADCVYKYSMQHLFGCGTLVWNKVDVILGALGVRILSRPTLFILHPAG